MAFQAGDIVFQITGDIKGLNKAMGDASANVKKNFGDISDVVGKAMVGAGLAITGTVAAVGYQALSAAEEVNAASMKMVAALGLPAAEAARFRDMIREVYGDNFGESLTDVGAAIQEVALGLKDVGVTSNDEIVKATENAIMLRDAYQVDVGESINAISGLMQNFGITSDEAFNFVTAGMQRGMNASGDFLESIGEYATQFSSGGATAAQFFNIMETGMQSGMLGTDKAADAFKEFRVRLLDGSKTTADAMALIGLNIGEITTQINNGTLTTAGAWDLVIEKLRGVTDQAVLLQAGVGLIGTQFEDLGAKTVLSMTMGKASMDQMAGATETLSQQYKTLANDWEGVKRKMVLAAESMGQAIAPALGRILDAVAPVIERFSAWVEKNPELSATLLAVGGAVGVVLTAVGSILMVLPSLVGGWTLVSGAVAAVTTAFGAVAAAIGAPVAVVVGAIAAIIAAGTALYYFWDDIKWGLMKLWEAISASFRAQFGFIISVIEWLRDVGLSVLEKAQSLMGFGGGGGGGYGGPAYASAGFGSPAYAKTGMGSGGGGGGGLGGGISLTFNNYGLNDPAAISRMAAEQLQLELRSRGL